jgi:glycosyltransferase involved in cell wall biosynthesis
MLYLDTFGASGGLGRCTIELLPALAERLDRVVLAGQSHVVDSYRDQLSETEKLRFWNLEHPRFHPGALLLRLKAKKQPGSTAFTETLLRRAGIRSRNSHPVLINYPQAIAPPRKDFGFDTFIHDLNWRHFPGNFPDPEALDHRCADWIRKSRRIFTNSDFTRQEIIEAYRIEPGRVISAPLAPPAKSPAFSEAETQDALKRASLKPDGFFFYPAAHGLHKGHDVLAAALEACGTKPVLPVVITARIDPDLAGSSRGQQVFLTSVKERLRTLRLAGRIISLPGLSWPHLMAIAFSCRAYVLPSKFEGFGFPLVEAMSLRKPSLCSDIPAFREILARYGSKIQAATFPSGDSGVLRDLLIEASRENIFVNSEPASDNPSAGWSWSDTAKAITDAL